MNHRATGPFRGTPRVASSASAPFKFEDVPDQAAGLKRMAQLIANGLSTTKSTPVLIRTARQITADCDGRDDMCEVEAIFDAVKNGTDKVPALSKGVRYVSDTRGTDHFQSAYATLKECEAGACAEDCDGHAVLLASLLLALGFKVGVRAWGPKIGTKAYSHVYAVVAIPKHGPWPKGYGGHGLDTTVPDSYVGWEPRKGETLTYWIEED